MDSVHPKRDQGSILVVDDDLSARQTLSSVIGREGYEVRCALSGQTALMFAREDPPDLILLDIRLPDMDGLQVSRNLKEDQRTCDIPVIFLSGLEDTEDKVQGFAAGGVDYITKPFQAEEVLARVKTHLALRHVRNRLERRVAERTADLARASEQLVATNAELLRESVQRETVEEALRERLRFEQLVADLSARFVNVPLDQVDSEIEKALGWIREFFQVDRCGLLRLSEDGAAFQITHACVAEGIPPVPAREDLPTALFPWAYQKVGVQHEVVSVTTLDDMPPEASVDKHTYREWGIQSHLNIPIVMTGAQIYIISINAVRKERVWPEEYLPRLRLLGEIFVNALERRRARLELDERLRFEGLISELSASFVNLPPDEVDGEINRWIERISKLFDVDLCSVAVFSEDMTKLIRVFGYYSGTSKPFPESLSREDAPWYVEQLIQGKPVVIHRVEELPAEAGKERQFSLAHGLKSLLSIPLASGGKILGSCALVSIRAERIWSEDLIQRFRLVTEVIANAQAHKLAERALQEAELKYRTVADFTYDWEYWVTPEETIRYMSPSAELVTGYPLLEFVASPSMRREIVLPEDRPLRDKHSHDVRQDHGSQLVQFRIRRKDGEVRWIEHACRPVFGERGEYLGRRASNRDITHRKGMEDELQARLREIEDLKRQLERENVDLREEVKHLFGHTDIVGQSEVMRRVMAQVEQVARTDSTVLILGETGTGKEPLAREIHRLSSRKDKLLVTVSCASLPPSLIESELFGREKGAYTGALTSMAGRFETADKGTLFLDEIGELPQEVQVKLLRILEEGQFERLGSSKPRHVDVRIIAATNRDLAKEVREGRFRSDLYYRLNVFPIAIPPLRERLEDIPLLVWTFVRQFEKKMNKRIDSVPPRVMDALQRYPWPGNIRELRNVIEHAMIVSDGRALEVRIPTISSTESSAEDPLAGSLEDVERKHIQDVLQKTGWRITGKEGAAEMLRLKRTTLQSRMKKLGIKRPSK